MVYFDIDQSFPFSVFLLRYIQHIDIFSRTIWCLASRVDFRVKLLRFFELQLEGIRWPHCCF